MYSDLLDLMFRSQPHDNSLVRVEEQTAGTQPLRDVGYALTESVHRSVAGVAMRHRPSTHYWLNSLMELSTLPTLL